MASRKTLLYYGALLHDIGRVLYRATDANVAPAQLGATFITEELAAANGQYGGEDGRIIAEQVRYHNVDTLAGAVDLQDDSLAYVTWFASSVTAHAGEGSGEAATAAGRAANLRRIFNDLNGHHDDGEVGHDRYDTIVQALKEGLAGTGVSASEVNALLSVLESTTSAIPAYTDGPVSSDVSFYDQAKITAAVASCVYEYLHEHGVRDYRAAFLDAESATEPNAARMFLLYSCDMSGIQDFIYNISGDGALKQLRARSMYLELLLEHIVDELLDRLELSRVNLLYTGGGHAYLLLPNTEMAKAQLDAFGKELRAWFVDKYRTDLYLASAWVECSADDLANRGSDKRRYTELYQRLSRKLSEAKAARYDVETIRALNFGTEGHFDHGRECSECHRSDLRLNEDNKCTLCAALESISKSLVDKDVFLIERSCVANDSERQHRALSLPFGCELRMYTPVGYRIRRAGAHRVYAKNDQRLPGEHATHLWMGDYTADTMGEGLSAYAEQAVTLTIGEDGARRGIKRLGVLRADVDDLGATFVSGLPDEKVSLARTSALSRSLSYFFKYRINDIMATGNYQAQIIYSGGDDLFIVGNWSDVLYAAIDIRKALDAFTGNGSLSISAGVGMYSKTYPIARMAAETGSLEDSAKSYVEEGTGKTKNAIALWRSELVFGWDEFVNVIEPRMRRIGSMFVENQKGTAFIYRLIDLLRSYDAVSSVPRIAYLLARSFEDDRKHGGDSSRQLYAWAQDPKERRRLVAALEWYVCSIREGSEQ